MKREYILDDDILVVIEFGLNGSEMIEKYKLSKSFLNGNFNVNLKDESQRGQKEGGCKYLSERATPIGYLVSSRSRSMDMAGRLGKWIVYAGDNDIMYDAITLGSMEPYWVRIDSDEYYEWRIRNCHYSSIDYQVSLNQSYIIVKTTNSKTRINISVPSIRKTTKGNEDGDEQEGLCWYHRNRTIYIKLRKPNDEIIRINDIISYGIDQLRTKYLKNILYSTPKYKNHPKMIKRQVPLNTLNSIVPIVSFP